MASFATYFNCRNTDKMSLEETLQNRDNGCRNTWNCPRKPVGDLLEQPTICSHRACSKQPYIAQNKQHDAASDFASSSFLYVTSPFFIPRMQIGKSNGLFHAKKHFAIILVLALAVPFSSVLAQNSEAGELQRLREENAALRKRLAELEGQLGLATAPVTVKATEVPQPQTSLPVPSSAAPQPILTADEGEPMSLSPFEVKSDKDYGYLKTNSVTATRVGMAIQDVPMNISVMSEDFIRDTGISSITDILRYTSSGSPDSRYAMRIPGNSSTPQGNFTLRGFTVNSLLRNGVFRYNSYNLDNVDRVEIVKGPAAVFFGQGYPGGVINYVTKKPIFNKSATSFSYAIDSHGGDKVVVDHNAPLSDRAAFRIVGAWTDQNGERTGEFRKNFNITPSLSLNLLKSGKLRANFELEYLKESYNKNDFAWIFPQGWFEAYQNPSPALIAAAGVTDATAYRARIFASPSNWITDVRKATNDPGRALYTTISPYGYYTDISGKRVRDTGFNFTNSGARNMNEVKTFQATIDASPLTWLDARYVYTKDNSRFDNFAGLNIPNADGVTFNAASSGAGTGYYRKLQDHQLDLIAKVDFLGVKNRLLIGGVHSRPFQQYMTSAGAVYYSVPGYNYPTPPVNNLPNGATATNPQVPVLQVLRDRHGTILTAQQVYSLWDPAIHVNPPVSKIYNIERNLLDGYKAENTAFYLNWEGRMLKNDRLTLLGGYRRESSKGFGQSLVANDPWFIVPETAYLNTTAYPENVYNYTAGYAGDPEGFRTRSGDSWMMGASYALTPSISLYTSVSKTFKINSGLAGGYDELGINTLIQDALNNGGGKFLYRGATITSVDQARAAIDAAGANRSLLNEDGKNFEVGLKTSLWDNKLVTTFSLFRGIRKNQKLDDAQAQSNASEPFNYSTTMFAPTSLYYNKRNFRWRAVGVKNQITGADFDVIWTPVRNYQVVVNGAWMWQAETLDNPTYYKVGTDKYNAATAGNQALYAMYYRNRIENVPEFRFNVFNKYTFTDTMLRGFSVALGARFSSETIISRSLDYNPDRGGITAGNYLIFDANLSYPWVLSGYKFNTSLGVLNLTDKTYYEGNAAPADHLSWQLRTMLSF